MEQPTLIMATNNSFKLSEVRQMVGDRYQIMGLADIGCHEDIPETADTLAGNALQKARYVHEHYGVDCFADDTGLEIEVLGGEPGVFTARYGAMHGYGESHDTDANIRCLMDKLCNAPNRRACFRTVIALIMGGREHLFEGVVHGEILRERCGAEGFGYDPVFAPEGRGLAFAQMPLAEKNRISHRGRAVRLLTEYLRDISAK